MRSWSIDAEALYVYDDAGQLAVEAAFASNDPVEVVLTSAEATAGAYEFAGTAFVTELELEFETNEVVGYSISMEGTGPLTRAVIASGGGGGGD